MTSRRGFTLLELLVVMGIMAILMSIGTLSFISIRRGAELRGATMTIRTTLMLARQQAVTKRQPISVVFDNGSNMISVVNQANGQIIRTLYLTPGVEFTGSQTVDFLPAGGATAAGKKTITIRERLGNQPQTITVWTLTGATSE